MGTENEKKIYIIIAVLLSIIIFFGSGYLLGVRNGSTGSGKISASESAKRANESADRTADRLDTTADQIRDAETTADSISRTGTEIRKTVDDINRTDSQLKGGLDDCAEIVDRCQKRNQRITEIINSTAGPGTDTGRRESDPSEGK